MEELKKALKKVKVIILIYVLSLFCLIIGSTFFAHFTIIAILFSLTFPFFIVGLVVYYCIQHKKYRERVILSKPKRRFRYLDSFYYMRKFRTNGETDVIYFVLHIIQDIDTERIYALDAKATNGHFQSIWGDVKILKGVGLRTNWKEVYFKEEGVFWVDEEIYDCYSYDVEDVVIKYFGNEHRVNINNELFHRNPEYDKFLLGKATFIRGFAEFNIN